MKLRAVLALAAVTFVGGCADPDAAREALDDMGFTDVAVTGPRYWGCGNDYSFYTGFRAKNPAGKPVTGVVCSGWLTGTQVKFDRR